jgi:OOP family OmpA-OmpF porin
MNGKALFAAIAMASFILVSSPATAQDGGLYLGASIGAAKARQVCENATNCDEDETGYKGFVGWRVNKYLAAEGGYQHFSMFGRNSRGLSANAFDLLAVGSYPVTDQFSAYARAGAYFSQLKSSPASEDTLGFTYSVGAEYAFSKDWSGRLDWQRYNNAGGGSLGLTTDIDVLSVGIVWRMR